mgnify:CR=1 FL=1|tara:strand:+ start:14515 stop:15348 length:834 start_codon:yes stop_codon:yes gene_type:complete
MRRHTGALLLAVVCGHVVLLSVQINTDSGVPIAEGVTFGLFSTVQRLTTTAVGSVAGLWDGYVGLRSVQVENDGLRRDVAELQFRLQKERASAQSARSLEALLGLRRAIEESTVSARVIAGDAVPYFRTVTIDRGQGSGVRRDLAVISPDGVVGRVVGNPGQRAAKVQLLVDRNAAAGALIERTRVAGLVVGDPGDGVLGMAYVSEFEDVRVGDVVVTSGIDGIYPKGLPIGDVVRVSSGQGLYRTIEITPRVQFNDLEYVLVIVPEQEVVVPAGGG